GIVAAGATVPAGEGAGTLASFGVSGDFGSGFLSSAFLSDDGTGDHIGAALDSAAGVSATPSLPETGRMGEAPSVISGEGRLAFGGATGSVPASFLTSGTGAVVGSEGGAGEGATPTAEGGGGGIASSFFSPSGFFSFSGGGGVGVTTSPTIGRLSV